MPTKFDRQTRQLAVSYEFLRSLNPNPYNPRIHTEKQIRQIAESIRAFGFNVPILVDANRNVMAGHGRVLAGRLLGLERVPVIRLEHLTEQQRIAFAIADNRLTENSTWDAKLLGEQFQILSAAELDFSLEATGFEMGEIDIYIEGLIPQDTLDTDPADILPESKVAVSKHGDLWSLGKHRLLCGDALLTASYSLLMGKKKAQLIFTDPPFNVPIDGNVSGFGKRHHREFAMGTGEMSDAEFTDFLTRVLSHSAHSSADGSLHYVFIDWRHIDLLISAGKTIYSEFKSLCVWGKDSGGQGSLYRSQHELICVFKFGKAAHRNNIQLGKFGRYRTNLWTYPRPHSFGRASNGEQESLDHPTVKPVVLVADAILDCSARGDLVLDPFLGSGTTILAAERTGRICHGIELDPQYVDTAIRRWQTLTGRSAIHVATGESFRSREEAALER